MTNIFKIAAVFYLNSLHSSRFVRKRTTLNIWCKLVALISSSVNDREAKNNQTAAYQVGSQYRLTNCTITSWNKVHTEVATEKISLLFWSWNTCYHVLGLLFTWPGITYLILKLLWSLHQLPMAMAIIGSQEPIWNKTFFH